MAANQFDIPAGSVAIAGGVAKSVVGLKASANVAVKLLEVLTSFDGTVSTNPPAVVEFMQSTFASNGPGIGGNSTSVPPAKRDPGRAETIQATAAKAWSAEPTVLALQRVFDVGQFNGLYHYIHPFASPFIVIGSQGCVVRVTSPQAVNGSFTLTGEE